MTITSWFDNREQLIWNLVHNWGYKAEEFADMTIEELQNATLELEDELDVLSPDYE